MLATISKPDGILFQGEATLAQLPGVGGFFEIMDQHAPIISVLKQGSIRLDTAHEGSRSFEVRGGVVEFHDNTLEILVQ